ncbi:R.Pab1 family restriction endonuclease [Helicobacter mesocricetorum]|uniref:R.Pab1 family restriction endonuclease n=1 Tax=Helicobacter mesocricetorum TaxID=87012 RepID=UPI000CF19997|nr:R.Pab1 family restriction endonuclease [Helicobacter mesocricetorum]
MKNLKYKFPLSKAMGKIRIKERFAFSDYGIPVAPTQTIMTAKHYIEWQIGYDKVVKKNESYHFIGANGKTKQIYELSEFLDFALCKKWITPNDIRNIKTNIKNYQDFIERKEKIMRTNFVNDNLNGIEFLKANVSYPLLIHRFQNNDLLCEIVVREKQFAVGTMPMLYFCVALSSLKDCDNQSFIGRKIQSNEYGYLEITKENIAIFIQIFRIFGLLSKVHQYDCLQILDYLLSKYCSGK